MSSNFVPQAKKFECIKTLGAYVWAAILLGGSGLAIVKGILFLTNLDGPVVTRELAVVLVSVSIALIISVALLMVGAVLVHLTAWAEERIRNYWPPCTKK